MLIRSLLLCLPSVETIPENVELAGSQTSSPTPPWSGLLLCKLLICGVTKNVAVFFRLNSLQNKRLSEPPHLTVYWPVS